MNMLSFLVTALLVGTPAHARDTTTEIDKIFSWTSPATSGSRSTSRRTGKVVVDRGYGLADPGAAWLSYGTGGR